MQCQICNTREATIHLTEINDGVRSEMHVCEHCATEQGIVVQSHMPINELLGNLLAAQPEDEEFIDPSDRQLQCPQCGFTLDKFGKKALLGCPYDYELFEKVLAPLIARAHDGKTTHCGKVPSKLPADEKKQMDLLNLKQQLEAAVKMENYELAAKLRDKIAEREKQSPKAK